MLMTVLSEVKMIRCRRELFANSALSSRSVLLREKKIRLNSSLLSLTLSLSLIGEQNEIL